MDKFSPACGRPMHVELSRDSKLVLACRSTSNFTKIIILHSDAIFFTSQTCPVDGLAGILHKIHLVHVAKHHNFAASSTCTSTRALLCIAVHPSIAVLQRQRVIAVEWLPIHCTCPALGRTSEFRAGGVVAARKDYFLRWPSCTTGVREGEQAEETD